MIWRPHEFDAASMLLPIASAAIGVSLLWVPAGSQAVRNGAPRTFQSIQPVGGPRDHVELKRDPFTVASWLQAQPPSARQAMAEPVRPPEVPSAPRPVLLGTVLAPDGSIAVCQVASDPPRLVRPGERIGQFALDSVRTGEAFFRDSAGLSFVVRLRPPQGS